MLNRNNLISFTTLMQLAIMTFNSSQAQWLPTVGLNGGKVHSIVVKDSITLAGSDTAGVFISTDNGLNWTGANNGLSEKSVAALLVKDNVIVAGMGNTMSGAMFSSTSNGANWVPATGQYYGYVFCLALKGTDMLAGTWYGVARSTNNGANWTSLSTTGLPSNALVAAIAATGTNIFAGVTYGSTGGTGVFLSTNNGSNWIAKNTGLTNTKPHSFAIMGSNTFVGTEGGVFLSINNGNSWTSASTGLTNLYINTLLVNGTELYAGTNDGIFISSDNGTSWTNISNNLPANTAIHSLAIRGAYLLAGTQTSVWRKLLPTGLNKLTEDNRIEIYPNPAAGVFTIEVEGAAKAEEITVTDRLGQCVYSNLFANHQQEMQIDLSLYPKGIYFLKLKAGESVVNRKITIQ